MKHAITVLEEARQRVLEHLKSDGADHVLIEKKKDLERAIAVLKGIGKRPLPEPFQVVALEAVDCGSFAEYRLLWDFENEERDTWHEIDLRLSAGDIVITSRKQFEEGEARRAGAGGK